MRILGIETTCDETGAAIVEDGVKIISNVVATSAEMHKSWGGIIPEQAARQQVKSIIPVIQEALGTSRRKLAISHWPLVIDVDAIAVTVGPGLIGSLLVGVETAKTLSWLFNKPIVPVNHLVAHIYANFIRENSKLPMFPALALVVSGGHTDLVLMYGHGKLEWVGGTRDDAAGEAFDKTARLLGLPYPGGPAIAAEAANYQQSTINNSQLTMFPRPLIREDNFDWSFSGLKTAVLKTISNQPSFAPSTPLSASKGKQLTIGRPRLAAEIQEAIVDVLVEKTIAAVAKFKPNSLLVAGGVSANSRLREKFLLKISNLKLKIDLRVPPPALCTDNGAIIASCAYFNFKPVDFKKIDANPGLSITGEL